MKKILKTSALLLVICAMLSLASCWKQTLSGTYTEGGLITSSLIFEGDNVTISAFGIKAKGTYRIEKDTIYMTYEVLGSEQTVSKSFSKSGNSIFIDGKEFVKEK